MVRSTDWATNHFRDVRFGFRFASALQVIENYRREHDGSMRGCKSLRLHTRDFIEHRLVGSRFELSEQLRRLGCCLSVCLSAVESFGHASAIHLAGYRGHVKPSKLVKFFAREEFLS